MSTELTIYTNCDTQDEELDTSGVDFVEVDTDNDYIIFSDGSTTVADGEAIPSAQALNQAGIVISDAEQVVSKYFLADISQSELKEIHNAGNQNKRYVFAFSFNGATASEPVLEVWDNSSLNTYADYSLGASDATSSWIRGVVTTLGLPGANWIGSKLAGSTDGHYLELNNGSGALTVADVLYCNLKVVVPASFANAGAEAPVLCVKYATN